MSGFKIMGLKIEVSSENPTKQTITTNYKNIQHFNKRWVFSAERRKMILLI